MKEPFGTIANKMEIRRITERDLPLRVEWMNHPSTYRTMHFDIPVTLEKTKVWYQAVAENEKRADLVAIESGKIVGFSGITGIDPLVGKGEIYFFVNPLEHHKGVGTEVMSLTLDYAFDVMHLNKIFSHVNEDNIPSIRVQQKLGFVEEGRMRKELLTESGELKDRLYMGLLREEWYQKRNGQ